MLGERVCDFLVEASPSAIARQNDGEQLRGRRPAAGRYLDDGQVAERNRRWRGDFMRSAFDQGIESGEQGGQPAARVFEVTGDLGQGDDGRAGHVRGEVANCADTALAIALGLQSHPRIVELGCREIAQIPARRALGAKGPSVAQRSLQARRRAKADSDRPRKRVRGRLRQDRVGKVRSRAVAHQQRGSYRSADDNRPG